MPVPTIPVELIQDYQSGRLLLADLAEVLGLSKTKTLYRLRALGVDTSMQVRKREQFARHVEAEQHLESGTAYATVAELYRQGYSQPMIADQLGISIRTVALILERRAMKPRNQWCRSVFRTAEGQPLEIETFVARLRALRVFLCLSQKVLARKCRLSTSTISKLELAKSGPTWETLYRLCQAMEVTPEALGVTWRPPWPLVSCPGATAEYFNDPASFEGTASDDSVGLIMQSAVDG